MNNRNRIWTQNRWLHWGPGWLLKGKRSSDMRLLPYTVHWQIYRHMREHRTIFNIRHELRLLKNWNWSMTPPGDQIYLPIWPFSVREDASQASQRARNLSMGINGHTCMLQVEIGLGVLSRYRCLSENRRKAKDPPERKPQTARNSILAYQLTKSSYFTENIGCSEKIIPTCRLKVAKTMITVIQQFNNSTNLTELCYLSTMNVFHKFVLSISQGSA